MQSLKLYLTNEIEYEELTHYPEKEENQKSLIMVLDKK